MPEHRHPRPPRLASLALALAVLPVACKSSSAPVAERPVEAARAEPTGTERATHTPRAVDTDAAKPTKTTTTTDAKRGEPARTPSSRTFEPPRDVEGLPEPPHLPEPIRELIWSRMQGHGTDMTLLLWAVLFLDYEGAGELARAIVAEPRFSRPIGPDDPTLNGMLPPEFFTLQDELVEKAKILVRVTSGPRDGKLLSRAYGELTSVCVRCHAAYLDERREP
ncbi:hypothetical protein L6R52_01515 [Myxococcota bacterium]|nr:hypothetical protein [Myxococcota bacterium]